MTNKIIPYNPVLKELARRLRRKSTLCEFVLWKHIRRRALGVEFHRQVPILEYIVDFYCHELRLAIEVDGSIHRYREEEDLKRQRSMERHDVTFIRFTNEEIKEDISNVLWRLQETVEELLQRKNISPSKGGTRYPAIPPLKGGTGYPAIPPLKGVPAGRGMFFSHPALRRAGDE